MALTTKRIIALPTQTDPQEGDYLAIDNGMNGTHKIPAGRIGVELDDTLTEAGKAADARATGDAIDALRTQLEVTGTASGAIATFSDGSTMPAKSVIVNIEPVQSGSGTPSPDNVRQISGWESVSVTVTSLEWQNLGGYWPNKSSFSQRLALSNLLKVQPSTQYTIHYSGNIRYSVQQYENESTVYAENPPLADSGWMTASTFTFTTTANTNYMWVCQSSPNYSYDITPSDGLGLWISSSDDTNYSVYTSTLPTTVYGGTLDMVSGEMVVDRAMVTLDGTQPIAWNDWRHFENGTSAWLYNQNAFPIGNNIAPISDKLESVPYVTIYDGEVGIARIQTSTNYSFGVRVPVSGLTTDATINAWLANNPITVVYELTTPQTYTLTGQEISTLLGENNVWADAGDVEITYVRDLNIAINNLIGE